MTDKERIAVLEAQVQSLIDLLVTQKYLPQYVPVPMPCVAPVPYWWQQPTTWPHSITSSTTAMS